MQTIELDIDSVGSPKEITRILHEKAFREGDSLVLKTNVEILAFTALVIVAMVLGESSFFKKKKREKQGDEILKSLLNKYNTAKELETDIEKEYGINIELATANPLDKAFGLWKNNPIDGKTLREKAWQKKR